MGGRVNLHTGFMQLSFFILCITNEEEMQYLRKTCDVLHMGHVLEALQYELQ